MINYLKSVCFIPIKTNSTRVPNKNIRNLGNKPLFQHVLDTVMRSKKFDNLFVDTDSKLVKKYCIENSIQIVNRDPELTKDSASGNDLMKHWIDLKPNYDIYFQIFVTSPFLTEKTIFECVNLMEETKQYDSVFTAFKEYTWFWFQNKPVNYDPCNLPRSQDAKPVIKETTSLYGIRKEAFIKWNGRIGKKPKAFFVNEIESSDIDTEMDFFLAEKILERKKELSYK